MNDSTQQIRSISVVVPVYNEKESLPVLFAELQQASAALAPVLFEFIFVDDGSTDKSVEILRGLAAKDPRVKAVIFKRNFGQTAAMSCGIKMAVGDIIIPMDADLQNDPADISKFLVKIEEGFPACPVGGKIGRTRSW